MEIRLLGVTQASVGERPMALGAAQQRAVLAMLALRSNSPVGVDALIDGLWGERAPPTAPKMVQLYVSQLRKLLDGNAEIVTRGRGYELRVADDAVDALRFERLVAEAERGDGTAAERALALWRGPPLADLADTPFAAAEIRRLEELWLRARELAIDAALAEGRHREVLGELDSLIAADPLRERPHVQRMLALYRSGRQADALAGYRFAHEVLTEQAGIEPGPELRRLQEAILNQDPALDLAGGPPRLRRRTPPRTIALLGAGVLAAVIAATVALASRDAPVDVPPNSVAMIDAGSNAVIDAIEVDDGPGPIASGAGFVWVLNLHSETATRIDVRSRRVVQTQGLGNTPGNLAASPQEVWVSAGCTNGGEPGALAHLFSARAGGVDTYGGDDLALDGLLPAQRGMQQLVSPVCALAADGRSAWIATNLPPGVVRADYDPVSEQTRTVWARALPRAPSAIAIGSGIVWATDTSRDAVHSIDARTGRVTGTLRVGSNPLAITATDDAVWVTNEADDSVSRIDLRTTTVGKPITVGDGPAAIATGAGAVWVANAGDGSVSRIDPASQRVTATIAVGHRPQGITVAGGSVWVTVRG